MTNISAEQANDIVEFVTRLHARIAFTVDSIQSMDDSESMDKSTYVICQSLAGDIGMLGGIAAFGIMVDAKLPDEQREAFDVVIDKIEAVLENTTMRQRTEKFFK